MIHNPSHNLETTEKLHSPHSCNLAYWHFLLETQETLEQLGLFLHLGIFVRSLGPLTLICTALFLVCFQRA